MPISRILRTAPYVAVIMALAGCGVFEATYPGKQAGKTEPTTAEQSSDGFFIPWSRLFGGGDSKPDPASSAAVSGFGVNGYLWRASLDTLSFLPLASADPFGGVIISDWYAPPESPDERFKATITITDRELRADAIHVALFRQTRSPGGAWVDAVVTQKTKTDFENAILTRARELRSSGAAIKKG